MEEIKPLRKPPQTMPSTPEELLAFVAWSEYYEGETKEEYEQRQALCKKLGEQYAEYCAMIKVMDKEINKPNIWIPKSKGHRK